MVLAAKFARTFYSDDIFTLFNNTDLGAITARIATDATFSLFRDIATLGTEFNALLNSAHRLN